jgi:hypothetical protein
MLKPDVDKEGFLHFGLVATVRALEDDGVRIVSVVEMPPDVEGAFPDVAAVSAEERSDTSLCRHAPAVLFTP